MATDLTSTLATTVATLIGAVSPSATTQGIWSTGPTTGGCVWRTTNVFFAGVSNKSCLGFWRDPANSFASQATVIGSKTLLVAAHVGPSVGGTGYCFKDDGTAVSFTIANVDQIPGTDVCIVTTAAALTGISIARVMPSNWRQYLTRDFTKIYAVYTTQDYKMFVAYLEGEEYGATPNFPGILSDAQDPYYTWFQQTRGGDSSSFYGWIINGLLVVDTAYGYGIFTENSGDWTAAIQAIMTARSGDMLTYADLSSYSVSSNPATYSVPPTPTPPVPPNQLSTIIKRIGAGGDYATIALAIADLTLNYTGAANYVWSLIGGTGLAGGTIAVGDIVGGASGSTLTVIADSANTATVTELIQNDSVGQAIVRSALNISTDAGGLLSYSVQGVQIGSSTSTANITLSSVSAATPALQKNSFVRVITTANPVTMKSDVGGICTLDNVGILANNSISATQAMVAMQSTTGTQANYALHQVSCHVAGNPLGFMKVALIANQIANLNTTSLIASSTNSSFKGFGTITLASGAATLILTGSGIRCGVWNATAVTATGVTVIDNTTDVLQGITSSMVFSDTTTGLRILTNATTLVTATTSPVAMDINGANRPQIMPWDSSARVYAGFVNANITISNVAGTASSGIGTVSWTAFAGADHYVGFVNTTSLGTISSGGTLALNPVTPNTFFVEALDASNNILAEGGFIFPRTVPPSLNYLILSVI